MTHLGIIGLINFNDWDDPAYPDTGGVNSVIKNILPHLKAEKIILYGITFQKENLFKEKKVNSVISILPIIYKSKDNRLPNRILGFILGWRLYKYFNHSKINFVYSHSEELCFWLSFKRTPYIHHLHTYVNALEVSGGKLAKVKILQKLWAQIRLRVIKRSAKIVAVNKDVVQMCRKIVGDSRIIQFPNYVDSRKFQFSPYAELWRELKLGDDKVLLHIGRITAIKGLELFVDCVRKLNLVENGGWTGILVGNGDYETSIVKYVKQRRQEDKIMFVGSVNNDHMLSKYYSLASVFLITSFSESVPLTLLESLSCGTPVVSTDVGIVKEVLNKNNGYVVNDRDVDAFVDKILASLPFKSQKTLLPDPLFYSVEHASSLLNKEFLKND